MDACDPQAIALRSHRDDRKHHEDSNNNLGNFQVLLEVLLVTPFQLNILANILEMQLTVQILSKMNFLNYWWYDHKMKDIKNEAGYFADDIQDVASI